MCMYYVQPVPERTKNKTPYPFQEEFNSWYEDRWKKKLPKYSITFFPIKIIYNLHSWKKKSFVNFGKLYINIKQTPFRCLEKKIKFKKKIPLLTTWTNIRRRKWIDFLFTVQYNLGTRSIRFLNQIWILSGL